MEFKRCARCGCFFESSNSVCCNCEAKDKQDIYALNNYLLDFPSVSSINSFAFRYLVSFVTADNQSKNASGWSNSNSVV